MSYVRSPMGVHTTSVAPPPVLLSPPSYNSLGMDLVVTDATTATSGTWPTIRKILYVPFFLNTTARVQKMWWLNGAAVSGNVLGGIYLSGAGLPTKQILTTSSTAQANINVVQEAAAVITLRPGRYFMALAMDNTTGTMFRWTISGGSGIGTTATTLGCAAETVGSFALPATATPITTGTSFLPVFGLAFRSLVA